MTAALDMSMVGLRASSCVQNSCSWHTAVVGCVSWEESSLPSLGPVTKIVCDHLASRLISKYEDTLCFSTAILEAQVNTGSCASLGVLLHNYAWRHMQWRVGGRVGGLVGQQDVRLCVLCVAALCRDAAYQGSRGLGCSA